MSILDGLRLFFGAIFILLLPGLVWSFVFFNRRGVEWIERIAISFGLSIVVVTLSLFLVNRLIGVRITGFNSVMVIILVTILPVIAYYLNRLIRRSRENDTE